MFTLLIDKILKLIKSRRVNVFIFFFLLAFLILLISKLSKTYTNTISFSIEKTNVSEEIILLNKKSNLNISVKTQGFSFLKYYFNEPSLIINFKNDVLKKDSVFIWTKNKSYSNLINQFNKDEEVIAINPDSLLFFYDSYHTKKIPIKLNLVLDFKPGYNFLEKTITLKPDSITIIGPEGVLKSINNINTETISLEDINENINELVELDIMDTISNLKQSHKNIKISATVKKFTEGSLNIPIKVINKPENLAIKIFPKVAKVKYYTSLESFSMITKKDFEVICDFSKITNKQNFMIAELVKVPNIVKSAKIDNKKIEFIINKK